MNSEWKFNRKSVQLPDGDGSWWIYGKDCSICLQPRPHYCDRGNWLATIDVLPEAGRSLSLDWADGWPRYYFDLGRARAEIEAWLHKRGQWVAGASASAECTSSSEDPNRITDALEPVKVGELFAFLVHDDEKNGEAVPGVKLGETWYPLMGADLTRIESLKPMARTVAAATGKSIIVAKFTNRIDIDSISAGQAVFDAHGGERNQMTVPLINFDQAVNMRRRMNEVPSHPSAPPTTADVLTSIEERRYMNALEITAEGEAALCQLEDPQPPAIDDPGICCTMDDAEANDA